MNNSIYALLLVILLAIVIPRDTASTDSLPIRCDQLRVKNYCEAAQHCKWMDFKICYRDRKRLICMQKYYGCKDKAFCEVSGNRKEKEVQCQKLKPWCKMSRKRCKSLIQETPAADIWHKNNLCFFAAFNGQCQECYYEKSSECLCMNRADYSDCFELYGEDYLNKTREYINLRVS